MRYVALALGHIRRAARFAFLAGIGVAAAGCALRPPPATFATGLPASIPATKPLAVVGDLQLTAPFVRWVMRRESNEAEQLRLVTDLQEHADTIGALVIVGDLVFTAASRSDWRRFDGFVGPLARRVPVLPAIGNHDYYCVFVQRCLHRVIPKNFRRRFPWFAPGQPYAVRYGELMLAFLDSETNLAAQGEWLERNMREWEGSVAAALIYLHRPPFTNTVTRGAEPAAEVRKHIVPRLRAAAPMPVVIAGHAHGYEHLLIDGVHYLVSAGGGGPRGLLAAARPNDIYDGRDCSRDESGRVLRPFNYLLIEPGDAELIVTVRGFCRADEAVSIVDEFRISLPEIERLAE
jgi:hypothetical protein